MDEQKIIASINRTRMATEITVKRAKERAAAMSALRLAATDIGAALHGSSGVPAFVAACGL